MTFLQFIFIANLSISATSFEAKTEQIEKYFESENFNSVINIYNGLENSDKELLGDDQLEKVVMSHYFLKNYQEFIALGTPLLENVREKENFKKSYELAIYLGIVYKRSNFLDSAISYYSMAERFASIDENNRGVAISIENKAIVSGMKRDYIQALNMRYEAREKYLRNFNIEDAMMITSDIAYDYFRLGALDSAMAISSDVFKYFETTENNEWLWRTLFRLGHIEKDIKNVLSEEYFKKSLRYTENVPRRIALSYSGIGESMTLNNNDSAKYFLENAYEIAKSSDDISSLIEINIQRAALFYKNNDLALGLNAVEEGISFALQNGDMLGYSSLKRRESEYYLRQNDLIKSLNSIQSAVDTTSKYDLKSNLAESLTQKFNILNHFERYKEALDVKEEEIKVQQEIFNDRSEAVYQILRTQNEMDKQESTIANQQLEIDNNNLQITIMYISIALVVSALVFIFWQYRTRSKYAQKLETMFLDSRHRYMNNLLLLKNWFNEGKTENNDEIISFAQNRIDAISTVNRHLDRLSYNKDTIESQSFLEDISHNLLANREFTSEIENVPINMSVSGPLGMITNEIITNGLKYGEEPYAIRFQKNGQGYVLEIEDHGPGIADPEKKGTGSKVLRLLSRQLKGELTYENKADHTPEGRGTLVSLTFKG